MLVSSTVKFMLYLSLHCETNENKQDEARFGPYFKKRQSDKTFSGLTRNQLSLESLRVSCHSFWRDQFFAQIFMLSFQWKAKTQNVGSTFCPSKTIRYWLVHQKYYFKTSQCFCQSQDDLFYIHHKQYIEDNWNPLKAKIVLCCYEADISLKFTILNL